MGSPRNLWFLRKIVYLLERKPQRCWNNEGAEAKFRKRNIFLIYNIQWNDTQKKIWSMVSLLEKKHQISSPRSASPWCSSFPAFWFQLPPTLCSPSLSISSSFLFLFFFFFHSSVPSSSASHYLLLATRPICRPRVTHLRAVKETAKK